MRLDEGLRHLAEKRFAVVLLDLGLPDSQGMDTLLKVREKIPEIPVIILTGLADEEFAIAAIHSGADEYLIKGQIDQTLLVRTIRYAMERRRIMEDLRKSEEQYRLLFDSNPLPLYVYSRDSLMFLAVNNAALHLYGYRRKDFLNMTIDDIHLEEDLPRLRSVLVSDGGYLSAAGNLEAQKAGRQHYRRGHHHARCGFRRQPRASRAGPGRDATEKGRGNHPVSGLPRPAHRPA